MGEGDGEGWAEDGLAARQDGRVYPVGRALRATWDADNHDTLGQDLTGLMIHLSRVPFPGEDAPRATRAPAESLPVDRAVAAERRREGWLARIGHLLTRR